MSSTPHPVSPSHGAAEVTTELVTPLKPRPAFGERYSGATLINLITYFLPALYATLSKLWIAQIDSSSVVTTDVYTYVGIFAEIVNEGYSRAAWHVIGDKKNRSVKERLNLSFTLIAVQVVLGVVLTIAFNAAAPAFAGAFVPREVRETSLTYVRISAFSTLFSVLEYAVSTSTRAFDRPDVPLVFMLVKTLVNIVLDLLFLSTVRVWRGELSVNMQGGIRLGCDALGALVGLGYFVFTAVKALRRESRAVWEPVATSETTVTELVEEDTPTASYIRNPFIPTLTSLRILTRTAMFTLLETALRNGLYLWQVSSIVALGQDYATAWGVFNTIRWGIVMVPASAFEQTTLAFAGHEWGVWKKKGLDGLERGRKDLFAVIRPAIKSIILTFTTEVTLALLLSFLLIRPFALYLSGSPTVADLTTSMFHKLDWCYVLWTCSNHLAATLLASWPSVWFYNSVVVNLAWVVPWCIVMTVKKDWVGERAWEVYAVVFGGSLVASALVVIAVFGWWWRAILKGRSMEDRNGVRGWRALLKV
ncbi:hypothetical protein HDV00_008905 [Rhizophlyctis rosea]|nr:hypothetical protein HDV00_008905 [Rhizophlyctis rosea]